MTEHIDDLIMVLDNDEGAYTIVREIVTEVGTSGPAEIGCRIKDFITESSSNRLADMVLNEFLASVSNRDLGAHYLDVFEDDLPDDEKEDEE